jgi:hypothetical protein
MASNLINRGRTAVLFLFLIGIPAAALLGFPHPDALRNAAERQSPQLATVHRPVDRLGERPMPPPGPASEVERTQRWTMAQQRLQRLGARYYRLDKDPRRDNYYFVCRLPSHPATGRSSEDAEQVFRRAGRDPLLLVESVAADIGLWLERQSEDRGPQALDRRS